MANTFAPFGFSQIGTASGPPNFALTTNPPYRISASYTTPLFFGDAVRLNSSGPTGFIEQWANGDGAVPANILVGIFLGCRYLSISQKKVIESRMWPGADATGDVIAYIADDFSRQFKVQAGIGSPITQANIGQTADIVALPVGNTATSISGMSLSTPGTAATNPFKIVNIITDPPGGNGTDITTPFNYVVVAMNNQQYKTLLGV